MFFSVYSLKKGVYVMADEGVQETGFYAKVEDKWYALVDWVTQKLHVPLDKLVNAMEEKGIPSLPIFAVFFLLLFCGIAFLALGGLAPSSVTFTVSVIANNEPIDGAQITLSYDQERLVETTENGLASFEEIPYNAQLTIAVEKTGFTKTSKRIKASDKPFAIKLSPKVVTPEENAKELLKQTGQYTDVQLSSMPGPEAIDLATRLGFLAPTSGQNVLVTVQVEEFDGQPVPDATLVYEAGTTSDSTFTDEDGRASFNVPGGATVSVAASKDGYDVKSTRFVARQNAVEHITLRRPSAIEFAPPAGDGSIPTPGSPPSRYSDLVVRVRGVHGLIPTEVPFANVTILNEDDTINNFSTGSSADDIRFRVEAGTRVYVHVEALGFVTNNSEVRTMEQGRVNVLSVSLQEAIFEPDEEATAANLSIIVKTQNNRVATGATVTVYEQSMGLQWTNVTTVNSTGYASFSSLPIGFTFIAVARQNGYVTNISEPIELSGETNYTLVLSQSNANNSAIVETNVTDFYGRGHANANISVKLEGYITIANNIPTDSRGKATVADLPAGKRVTVTARKEGFVSNTTLTTLSAEVNKFDLVLLPPIVPVLFKATDLFTNQSVTLNNPSFHVFVDRLGTTEFASCTQTSSNGCTPAQAIFSNLQYAVTTTAEGYYQTTTTFNPAPSEYYYLHEVQLVPTTFDQLVSPPAQVQTQIKGEDQRTVNSLEIGKAYQLTFVLNVPEGASEAGFYFQAGDKIDDGVEVLRSNDFNYENTIFATPRGDITATHSLPGSSCGSGESANGLFKNVLFHNLSTGAYVITVPVFVKHANKETITLHYSAYAVTEDGTSRAPEDTSASDRWCKHDSYNITLTVTDPAPRSHKFNCGVQACIDISYSQEGGAPQGGDGYAAQLGSENPLNIRYTITDFNPSSPDEPTGIKLTVQEDKLRLDPTDPNTRNQRTVNVSTRQLNQGRYNAPALLAWVQGTGLADLLYDYSSKMPQLQSYILLYTPALSISSNTYYISYDEEEQMLSLKVKNPEGQLVLPTEVSGEWSHSANGVDDDTILLFTDPIMPADAVYLELDYDSLPINCRDTELMLTTEPIGQETRGCFNYDNTKKLLKYDASNPNPFGSCALYNISPNQVTEYPRSSSTDGGIIRFNIPCLGVTSTSFKLQVKKNPAQITAWDNRPAGDVPAVYKSNMKDLGYAPAGCEFIAPLVYVIVNNRQWGSIEYPHLAFGTEPNLYLQSLTDKLTNTGAYAYVANENAQQKLLLASSYVNIEGMSIDLNRRQVREILEKTVFRRSEHNALASAAARGFPFSAFTASSSRQIRYYWGSTSVASTDSASDYVTNYAEASACEAQRNRGVFIKNMAPRENTWQAELPAWDTRAQVVSLSASQYHQSPESKCGFARTPSVIAPASGELPEAAASGDAAPVASAGTNVTLCGTGYWTCGGGCVLPKPLAVPRTSLRVDEVQCARDSLVKDLPGVSLSSLIYNGNRGAERVNSREAERFGFPSSGSYGNELTYAAKYFYDEASSPSWYSGENFGQATQMPLPILDMYFLHQPTCMLFRYWKRGVIATENCEWLCVSDFLSFQVYDWINPFTGYFNTTFICPSATIHYIDGQKCKQEFADQIMADWGLEGAFSLVSPNNRVTLEIPTVFQDKTLFFKAGTVLKGGEMNWVYGRNELCETGSRWTGRRTQTINVQGRCDLFKLQGECIYTNREGSSVCEGGCGNDGQPCCQSSGEEKYCLNGLFCNNNFCSPESASCGKRGDTPCSGSPADCPVGDTDGCCNPLAELYPNGVAYVNEPSGTCQWRCAEGFSINGDRDPEKAPSACFRR